VHHLLLMRSTPSRNCANQNCPYWLTYSTMIYRYETKSSYWYKEGLARANPWWVAQLMWLRNAQLWIAWFSTHRSSKLVLYINMLWVIEGLPFILQSPTITWSLTLFLRYRYQGAAACFETINWVFHQFEAWPPANVKKKNQMTN
jgi:hypothetical protein